MPPFQPRSHPGSPYSFPRSYPPYGMPPHMPRRPRTRGGFLKNLLSRKGSSSARGVAGFERSRAAGSFVSPAAQKLANPASLQEMLANTQQFLQTIQQMGPVVQQYGPLVKNLPAMWKLYRGLKNLPDVEPDAAEDKKTADSTESEAASTKPKREKQPETTVKKASLKTESPKPQQTAPSRPKLYI